MNCHQCFMMGLNRSLWVWWVQQDAMGPTVCVEHKGSYGFWRNNWFWGIRRTLRGLRGFKRSTRGPEFDLQGFHLVLLKVIFFREGVKIASRKNNWCLFFNQTDTCWNMRCLLSGSYNMVNSWKCSENLFLRSWSSNVEVYQTKRQFQHEDQKMNFSEHFQTWLILHEHGN